MSEKRRNNSRVDREDDFIGKYIVLAMSYLRSFTPNKFLIDLSELKMTTRSVKESMVKKLRKQRKKSEKSSDICEFEGYFRLILSSAKSSKAPEKQLEFLVDEKEEVSILEKMKPRFECESVKFHGNTKRRDPIQLDLMKDVDPDVLYGLQRRQLEKRIDEVEDKSHGKLPEEKAEEVTEYEPDDSQRAPVIAERQVATQ